MIRVLNKPPSADKHALLRTTCKQPELFRDGEKLAGLVAVALVEDFTARSFLRFLAINAVKSIIDIRREPVFPFGATSHLEISDYIVNYGIAYIDFTHLTNTICMLEGSIQSILLRDIARDSRVTGALHKGLTIILSTGDIDAQGIDARYISAISNAPGYRAEMHEKSLLR